MRTSFVVPCLLALAALAATALAGDLEDAQALQKAGKFEEALPLYEKAATADPASADAALGLTVVLTGLGRYDEAAKAASAGIKGNAEHMPLLVAKARVHLLMADRGDRESADPGVIMGLVADGDAWLKRALKVDPKSADARVLKAKVMRYQGGGSSDQSAALLNEVIVDFPDHFDSRWDLAKHHERLGRVAQAGTKGKSDWALAELHFTRCFEIDPTSGMSVLNATYAKAWQRVPGSELASGYEDAAKLLPGNEKVLSQLYGAFGKKDPEGRVKAFERVDTARPGDPRVMMFLAYALKDAGRSKQGLAVLKKAEKIAPQDPMLPLNRGHILHDAGDTRAAVGAYASAIAACGEAFWKSVYDPIDGRAFKSAKLSPGERESIWEALWKAYPGVAQGSNNAGLWFRDTGRDFEKSAKWYLRAVEAAPKSVGILNDTGLIFHYNLKKYKLAEEYYRRALDQGREQGLDWTGQAGGLDDVGYRDALNNMGRMLSQLGRKKDLAAFCEEHVPEEHPSRAKWLRDAGE